MELLGILYLILGILSLFILIVSFVGFLVYRMAFRHVYRKKRKEFIEKDKNAKELFEKFEKKNNIKL